jgi:hypothetical protein
MSEVKLIAYYLPQYHPIPENDKWWNKGFTEWTNVTKARPLFKGHNQPRYPADLGYYDLRLPEIREQQVQMAKDYGIQGFCYYHYWFGNGKQLLERPFNEVLATGKPDFPFMLCWANENWKGVWFGASKGKLLIEQQYPGKQDYIDHFNYLQKAFEDERYIRIDDKPVFHVYRPGGIPDIKLFVDTFNDCAVKAGLKGIYFLASNCSQDWIPEHFGFDGMVSYNFHKVRVKAKKSLFQDSSGILGRIENRVRLLLNNDNMEERAKPSLVPYSKMIELVGDWPDVPFDYFPQIVPDWDNSARAGVKSLILTGSTPELWARHIKDACNYVQRYDEGKQFVFIKSWNEWAEGNYLEPDQKWGTKYLETLQEVTQKFM